ncbi:FabD/lysophospholipase-like protein [Aspergillus affinis]|uniref:FabD/lysophospholipase-like protein n=1 Tax=Aspergillus affinis TaxID=1070780 RepID=UPI0022FDB3BA|nr:FabD/lysophospholipase-like protein [Aspergillus affinis]KAI9035875.1 FabD/lysophospholipase-like protein [Aspergillus affinis]
MSDAPDRPLRLLSLDGGGVRGISELIILDRLMRQVQHRHGLPTVPKPCDIFDLIGGTSTGGLIAILLGRLELSVQQAIDEYRLLSKVIFGPTKAFWKDGKFKASRLERAVEGIVRKYLGGEEGSTVLKGEGRCKVFVCAKRTSDVAGQTHLFRSYSGDTLSVAICDAARATSAAPIFFKRKLVMLSDGEYGFVDGALGANNPAKLMLRETREVFPLDRPVGCVVSIGTGKKFVSPVQEPGRLQRFLLPLPVHVIRSQKDFSTSCELVAEELEEKFYDLPEMYFRFNVEHGLQDVGLDQYKKLGRISLLTRGYLQGFLVRKKVERAADSLYKNDGKCLVSDL